MTKNIIAYCRCSILLVFLYWQNRSNISVISNAVMVRCLYTLIMHVNVVVIWGFLNFFELFFFQVGITVQHISLIT